MNQLLVFCVRQIPTILSIVEVRSVVLVSVTDLHFLASRRVALLVASYYSISHGAVIMHL